MTAGRLSVNVNRQSMQRMDGDLLHRHKFRKRQNDFVLSLRNDRRTADKLFVDVVEIVTVENERRDGATARHVGACVRRRQRRSCC